MQTRLELSEAEKLMRVVFAGKREMPRRTGGSVEWPTDWCSQDKACWAALDEALTPWPGTRNDLAIPTLPEPKSVAPKHRRRIKLMNPVFLALVTGGIAAIVLLQSAAG